MKISKLNESGYEEAVLGFSLSYNIFSERAKEILPKFAFGVPGENKFLESIITWWDITAPRFWWIEADTYRISTKQSESTMHTLLNNELTQDSFEDLLPPDLFNTLCKNIEWIKSSTDTNNMSKLLILKNLLPEGFLQRRIWVLSYKALQNIIIQRINHRLPQWKLFCKEILNSVEHPEFLLKEQR